MKKDALQINTDNFLEERLQSSYEEVTSKKEYKKIFKQYFMLFQKLQDGLVNKEDLLEQYETKEEEVYKMQLKQAYKRGFKDCMEIFINKKNDSV